MAKPPHNEHELELALTRLAGSNEAVMSSRAPSLVALPPSSRLKMSWGSLGRGGWNGAVMSYEIK